ncbi:hypothetical protein HYH03_011317 [Edaphochlamys debaryana]|uniref:Uncharacterized protein n=1 Tax=Edaphochlamys debaryana TaxID=47281 RepID=A0A835Y0A9_9CHLO|nr:hypothetical protein HYH03_011317 [Edaphochlamys debaryana]|eukprot:KAG2490190.1 hypothetical protein HYH03_011317 [Edaphochlamys debaryana]
MSRLSRAAEAMLSHAANGVGGSTVLAGLLPGAGAAGRLPAAAPQALARLGLPAEAGYGAVQQAWALQSTSSAPAGPAGPNGAGPTVPSMAGSPRPSALPPWLLPGHPAPPLTAGLRGPMVGCLGLTGPFASSLLGPHLFGVATAAAPAEVAPRAPTPDRPAAASVGAQGGPSDAAAAGGAPAAAEKSKGQRRKKGTGGGGGGGRTRAKAPLQAVWEAHYGERPTPTTEDIAKRFGVKPRTIVDGLLEHSFTTKCPLRWHALAQEYGLSTTPGDGRVQLMDCMFLAAQYIDAAGEGMPKTEWGLAKVKPMMAWAEGLPAEKREHRILATYKEAVQGDLDKVYTVLRMGVVADATKNFWSPEVEFQSFKQ